MGVLEVVRLRAEDFFLDFPEALPEISNGGDDEDDDRFDARLVAVEFLELRLPALTLRAIFFSVVLAPLLLVLFY